MDTFEEEPPDAPPAPPEASWNPGGQNPHNLDAEAALLGGILVDPEQFDLIEGKVAEDDFFAPSHGMIFAAMQAIRKSQRPIDPILLRNELREMGRLDAVGGVAGLSALLDAATSGANVEHYAEIIQDLAALRRLVKVSLDSIQAATAPGAKAMDLLGNAEQNVQAIVTKNFHGHVLPIREVLKKTWDTIDMMLSNKGGGSGLLTHFTHLDQMLTGFHEDELIIVAGRPSMGKTTFALNILRNVAAKSNLPAVVFTLEMSAENIARNMLCAEARVEAQKLRSHSFSPRGDEMRALSAASATLQDAPLFIDETPAISLSELRGKARHLHIRHGIRLIVIDYLQLMTASSLARNRSREQEVSEISRGLKALAKELHIPVVALSQLSRKPENRTNPVPILSDLRESGAIEQDADVVLMLHRPEYYAAKDAPESDRKAGEAEVIVAKQRNGPTGTANLAFIGNQLRFENLSVTAGYTPPDAL